MMKEKDVVSSFICTPPTSERGLTFALFKRSLNVSTYQEKWGVCSGGIEETDPSPEAAARREIEEETLLTSSDITLLRRGKPFQLVDSELQTRWTIHPFAFLLNDTNKKLIIEGEHTEYRFIKPADLKNYDTVPALAEDMNRLLFGPETEAGLTALREDHENGAEVLALKALNTLLKAIRGPDLESPATAAEFWKALRVIAWTLAKDGRVSMAPAIEGALFKALSRVTMAVEVKGGSCFSPTGLDKIKLDDFKTLALEQIEETILSRQSRVEVIAKAFTSFVSRSEGYKHAAKKHDYVNILTLSSSSSVTAAVKLLIQDASKTDTKIRLQILESRPRFEGVACATDILRELWDSENLKVEILSDASVAYAAKTADFTVIGADKLAANGDVNNKIGSLAACALTKTLRPEAKVVVVTSTDKITLDAGKKEETESNDKEEMTQAWPPSWAVMLQDERAARGGAQVEVRNAYFEWVPAEYVDIYVTDEGEVDKKGVKGLAAGKGEVEKKLFADL